jgi:hypothetical protein
MKDKEVTMARPLGDAYSEHYLKEKGVIGDDVVLPEGWDKEELPTDEEMLNPVTEVVETLDADEALAELIAKMQSEELLDDETEDPSGEGLTVGELKARAEREEEIAAILAASEEEAEALRIALASNEAEKKALAAERAESRALSPRAMHPDVRKKYVRPPT